MSYSLQSTDPKVINIVARNLILRRSGTYQPQFHRNFEAVASMGELNRFAETVASAGMTTINPTIVAKSGSEMLSLSSGVSNPNAIAIPHQWGQQRAIFILELDVSFSTGGGSRYIIQGYTDYDGFTGHNIDPNMRMYINNVLKTQTVNINSAMGSTTGLRVASNFQTPTDFSSTSGFSSTPLTMTRPQDVFGQMKNQDMSLNNVFVTDHSASIGSNLVSSRRRNNIPSSYLANVFNGYATGLLESNAGDMTSGDVAEQAFSVVLEHDAIEDVFLRKLRETNGFSRGRNHFTYAELCRVAPNVDQIKNLISSSTVGTQLSQAGDSNHFQGQTLSTVAAVQLATAIPSLMLECMLSSINVTISNLMSNQLDMAPANDFAISCFSPEEAVRQYMLFKNRVLNEVVGPLTKNNQLNFHASIQCSFHAEFVVTIRIGSDPETRFVTPAFADSITSPMVASSPAALADLAGTLATMCTHIGDVISNTTMAKDRIISSSLTGAPLSGALNRDGGKAFAVPQPLHNPLGSSNSMGGYSAAPVAPLQRSSGPSATSM